ncbi:MAG TPA: hotdog fold thioesterase [Pseudonocardia sp.]|nr:hotdog fold thioesterase [Pseudonocardia sp.]
MIDLHRTPTYQAPAEALMGVRVLDATPESTRSVQTILPPAKLRSLGWAGVLVDTSCGRSIAVSAPPGTQCLTTSMHIELVRPSQDEPSQDAVDGSSWELSWRGRGRPVHLDENWALGEVLIEDAGSGPLIRATTRFLMRPGSYDGTEPADPPVELPAPADSDDLLARFGLRRDRTGEATTRLTYTPRPEHANPHDTVHGGLHAAMLDLAMNSALEAMGSASDWTLLALDIGFHRPIPVAGEPAVLEAKTRHSGRRTALAEAWIRTDTGKLLTTARGHYGRPPAENGTWRPVEGDTSR